VRHALRKRLGRAVQKPDDEIVHVYVSTYTSIRDARNDLDLLTRLYAGTVAQTYETNVLSHELDGKVTIVTADSRRHGKVWIGLASGQLGGLLVPPFVLWDDTMGVDGSGTVGRFWRGLSSADVRAIADRLQRAAAALIVISEAALPIVRHWTPGRHAPVFQKLVTADTTLRTFV